MNIDTSTGLPSVTVAEAIDAVAGGAWLLDVREQSEWENVHASAAHLIPVSSIPARSGELPEGEPILVICHSGYRSARVTEALRRSGYDAVNVRGGMDAWQSAGGVVVAPAPGPDHA